MNNNHFVTQGWNSVVQLLAGARPEHAVWWQQGIWNWT